VLLILFIQRRPRGMFPLKGRGGRGMISQRVSVLDDRTGTGGAIVLALLNQFTPVVRRCMCRLM